jgi:ADP-heptose:LPS heptosyltransferase
MFLSLIFKICAAINLWIGLLLRQRTLRYNSREIKSILIKRTDRLGDAVVTLPLIAELNRHYAVTVLTSSYNDYFLKEFVATKILNAQPLSFIASVTMIAKSIMRLGEKPNTTEPAFDLCLDLNGVRELDIFLNIRSAHLCRYYSGFNLGLWNGLLDYSENNYPVLFTAQPLLETCRTLAEHALGQTFKLLDYFDFSSHMRKPADFNVTGDFILVNIAGAEKFRGPNARDYAKIVNGLNFYGSIVIMDELASPHINEFKKFCQRDKVIYLERDYSVWELLFISSLSRLYIGSDSGITNLLQMPTNAFIFYGTGDHKVWRPYSINPYRVHENRGITIEESVNSQGFTKRIIYAPKKCRPCFDLGCAGFSCIRRIASHTIIEEINLLLQDMQLKTY